MPVDRSKTQQLHKNNPRANSRQHRGFNFRPKRLQIPASKKYFFWILTIMLLVVFDLGYIHFRQQPPFKKVIDQVTTIRLKSKNSPISASPETLLLAPTPNSTLTIDTTNWQIYSNDELSLSFRYPTDWKIIDASASATPDSLQISLDSQTQEEAVGNIDHKHSYYQRMGFVRIGDYYAERFSHANGKYNSEYVIIPFEPSLTITIQATTTSLSSTTDQEIATFDQILTTLQLE